MRRVVWDEEQELEDLARILELDPNAPLPDKPTRLQVTDANLDVERWRAFEEAAASVVVPAVLFPGRVLSVDGVMYGIEYSSLVHSVQVEWKLGLPKEWQPLTRWTQQVHDFFDESLNTAR